MIQACGFSKDKELWDALSNFDLDEKEGILDISRLQVGGGHPARRLLEKLQVSCVTCQVESCVQLRKRGLESDGSRTDMFFVLPDVLPLGTGTRGLQEMCRQLSTLEVSSARIFLND